jgi:uncharacterized protein YjdB
LAWSSSDESVATVDANGLVTALKVGNATITVATTDGSNLTATCEVKVDKASGVADILSDAQTSCNIYTLNGVLVKAAATAEDVEQLATGYYIINGKKIFIK